MLVVWRARGTRKRWIILGCAVLGSALSGPLVVLLSGQIFCQHFQPRIGIRAEGDRLFAETARSGLWPIDDWYTAQATGLGSQPIDILWPPIPVELLAVSETEFFERLSTAPVTFSRDNRGKATGLTLHYRGKAYSYKKVSDEPPKAPELPKPHVAISLDAKLDTCVGQYEFPPDALSPSGLKLTIWREGDQLLGQVRGDNVLKGAFDIFPESETVFFLKVDGSILTFMKNDQGQVTRVTHHLEGYPTIEGKKLKGDSSR
jgi:hypothetical protein